MNKEYMVDFSGWIKLSDSTLFQSLEDGSTITLVEYDKLCKNKKDKYILHDIVEAQKICIDGQYDSIDITEYNNEE